MRRFLTLSVPDPDLARRGTMVLIIALLLLATTLTLLLVSLGLPFLRVFVLPCLVLAPLLGAVTFLLYRGVVQGATVALLAMLIGLVLWAALTPQVAAVPGIDAAIAVTYGLLLMLSAFLWAWWSAGVVGIAVLAAQAIAVQLVPTTRTVHGIALLSFLTTAAVVMLFARSFHRALADARAQARAAQDAQHETAAREMALATMVEELEASHTHIQRLYAVVQDLETPIIPLLDGALVMPIVGHLDHQRTSRLQQTVYSAVYSHRAHVLIVDLTGLAQPEIAVLQELIQIVQGVQLLGTRLILTGIGAGLAQQIAEAQLKLPNIQTLRSLNEGIQEVLRARRYEVVTAAR